MRKLNYKEASVLNYLQNDLKVSDHIFKDIAENNDLSLKESIDIIRSLKSDGIIRNISGSFDSRKLGYSSELAAFKVKENDVDKIASKLAGLSDVSYVYCHDCEYQLWFRIAFPAGVKSEEQVKKLAHECGAEDYLTFKTEMKLRLKTVLNAISQDDNKKRVPVIELLDSCGTHDSVIIKEELRNFVRTESEKDPLVGDIYNEFEHGLKMKDITEEDVSLVKILQMDLPLTENPVTDLLISCKADYDSVAFCKKAEELKKCNILRRYGARVRHDYTGYKYNALTVWNIEGRDINSVKDAFSKVKNVTEISVRSAREADWKYNLFAIFHSPAEEEFFQMMDYISKESGINDCRIFKTLKEYKREKIKYFTGEDV